MKISRRYKIFIFIVNLIGFFLLIEYLGLSVVSLQKTIYDSDYDRFNFLLTIKPGLAHSKTRIKDTPLHFSASANNPEMTKKLLKMGVNPNIPVNNGRFPIHSVWEKKLWSY